MPLVSIILAVYNEAPIIERAVRSLLEQELPAGHALEVLVVDGESSDESAALVAAIAAREPRVRLLRNPQRKTPFAFNIGLREARGEYVCVFGAHSVYARDYVAVCLQELERQGAVGVSGRVIPQPAGSSIDARLAYWALSHPFGVSGRSARTQPEGFVDSIPFGLFRRDALLALGGYDEAMIRNQDNDMNYRLRAAGHKLYCTWRTSAEYQARPGLRELMQYARQNGAWCGISFRKQPRSLGLRHYVPFLFTASAVTVVPVAMHLAIGHAAATALALRERDPAALLMPWVFLAFHLVYGWSFAEAAVKGRA